MAIDAIRSSGSQAASAGAAPRSAARDSNGGAPSSPTMSPAEQRQLEALKQRDRQVRAHELAHLTAAGGLANGGATFSYQRGPDGVYYAIGGEVSISLREGRTPEETLANARTIKAAALAPADPSAQDRSVAAAAVAMEAKARSEQAATQAGEGLAVSGAKAGETERSSVSRTREALARTYRDDLPIGAAGFSAQA